MKSTGDAVAPLERLGFIGLGNMGGAIALRLLRAGYLVTVLDLDKKKMQALIENGAGVAATPKELAERSTIILADAKKNDLVFVDLSSTAPELAIKVSEALRARGIEMLDAPVSGADIGATNGNLTIFVGGDYAAYQRCLPVLQYVGRTVTYLGKNGNGQIGKRINQMMQAMSELAIYEGLLLAKKTGLDLKMFARAASGGCAQSWRLDELVDNIFNKGDKTYKLGMRSGRTGNALKMAEELGLRLAGATVADQIFSSHGWQLEIDFERNNIPDPA
jgi:3-hydroxyisobutyrate dehydrogenase-like beta-hydroxyacid dehydrogenase